MTKQELARKVAADAGLNGPDAKAVVDATFDKHLHDRFPQALHQHQPSPDKP